MATFQEINQYFEQTYSLGHSQALLLIGKRGIDYDSILQRKASGYNPIILRLSGLICSKDTAGLYNLALQLSRKKGQNCAVTSKISEILSLIVSLIAPNDNILIVIANIELFAHRIAKQHLLYSVLELIIDTPANICLVGITSRVDFIELLEKRIRSRFSYQTLLDVEEQEGTSQDAMLGRPDHSCLGYSKIERIKGLSEFELVVLLICMKCSEYNEITPNFLYWKYTLFKDSSRMMIFIYDKNTFIVLLKHLIEMRILLVKKKATSFNYHTLKVNVDVNRLRELVNSDELIVPTAIKNWVIGE